MNSFDYRVRRATLDDLGQLMSLWGSMGFAGEGLARRITEFQVAEAAGGVLVGAIGLQIADRQGWLHSEAFTDFGLADRLRPMLWQRLEVVAANQGLARLWTRESAPFWRQSGLVQADKEALQRLPPAWGPPDGHWLTLRLKADVEALLSADAQLALVILAEKQRTARLLKRATILKRVATAAAILVLAGVLGAAAYLVWRNKLFVRGG